MQLVILSLDGLSNGNVAGVVTTSSLRKLWPSDH